MEINYICIVLSVLIIVALFLFLQERKNLKESEKHRNELKKEIEGLTAQHEKTLTRFQAIADVEAEAKKLRTAFDMQRNKQKAILEKEKQDLDNLKVEYKEKKAIFDKLLEKISVLEENLEFVSFGVYKPHFDLIDSESYKKEIVKNKEKQKQLIKNKKACVCHTKWTVEGSKQEGQKMTERQIKLMLRAFNNECDSAILKVRWNNVNKMEQRMDNAYKAINKLGESNKIEITYEYLKVRLDELYLAYEHQQKIEEEKEEKRRIRELMREEAKIQKEIEKATKEAEGDEQRYEKSLEQARKEMEKASEEKRETLLLKVAELEKELENAHAKEEKALSQAQLTKSGYVYIISNIGSFGENVYKIGMTRRLEPMDRVKELGDASVPFGFDLHALVYSENAPELENILHKKFNDRRINAVNNRKEFFSVSLEEIEEAMREYKLETEIIKTSEAKEFRETIVQRNYETVRAEEKERVVEEFPVDL